MWNLIDPFLNDISSEQGYERDSLSFVVELCGHGGPTVTPDQRPRKVYESVTAGPNITLPSGWYDTIGSNHLDYHVVHTVGSEGKTKIPTVLYSFQHHPLAGCCRMGIQRWVRCNDNWSKKLEKRALKFRLAVAAKHGCNLLVVSSGPSGSSSGELYNEFEEIFAINGGKQKLYGIKTS